MRGIYISIVSWRNRVFDFPNELDSQFGDAVALQRILDKPTQDLDVYHFQSSLDRSAQDVGVSEVVTGVGQLDELCQRVVVEEKRELVVGRAPSGDGRTDV